MGKQQKQEEKMETTRLDKNKKTSWGWASEQKKDFFGQKLWKKLSLNMSKICQK